MPTHGRLVWICARFRRQNRADSNQGAFGHGPTEAVERGQSYAQQPCKREKCENFGSWQPVRRAAMGSPRAPSEVNEGFRQQHRNNGPFLLWGAEASSRCPNPVTVVLANAMPKRAWELLKFNGKEELFVLHMPMRAGCENAPCSVRLCLAKRCWRAEGQPHESESATTCRG